MDYKFFRVLSQEIIDECRNIRAGQDAARQRLIEIADEVGARTDEMFTNHDSTRLIGFFFKYSPTGSWWKRVDVLGQGREREAWYPTPNRKPGRLLLERIEEIKACNLNDVLPRFGIDRIHDFVWELGITYSPTIDYIPEPEQSVIRVPYGLRWSPGPHLEEIEEWEYLKAVSDYKKARAA